MRLKEKNIDYLALGHIHEYSQGQIDLRGKYAYSGCLEGRGFDELGEKGFILIDVSDGVVGIGKSAFVGAKISELKLPKNLTRIGDYAFWRCENLESLEMPGVTALGNYVFSNCEKLSRLVVSSEFFKSKDISPKAFGGEEEEFYDLPSASVKENTVDVFVTDGISGLNISEIKAQNKWIRSIQSLNQENNANVSQQTTVPDTGLTDINNIILNILICLGVVSVLKLKTKN